MALAGVPEYPAFRRLTLDDKQALDALFEQHPSEISERTFGSMFSWRTYRNRSELSQLEGHVLISWHRERLGRLVLPPVGPDPAVAVHELTRPDLAARSPVRGVFGLVGPLVEELGRQGLDPVPLRDEWDYVYRVEDLARLSGPRYHTQRKEMKKATSSNDLVFSPMTPEHREACLELEETWCDLKHCKLDDLSAAEDRALREAIENMEALGLMGAVVLVDGIVQALTVGEQLNASTAVVHFEKANPAVRGLYQVINRRFCENMLKGFEFVNREQDVGEPGLRRAKEGYHPHHFVEKHMLPIGRDASILVR